MLVQGAGLDVPEAVSSGLPPPWKAPDAAGRLAPGPVALHRTASLAIIDSRSLFADCLVSGLLELGFEGQVRHYRSVAGWLAETLDPAGPSVLVLLSTAGRDPAAARCEWTALLAAHGGRHPVVLLADDDGTDALVDAFEAGVRGYIPMSLPLNILAQALDLVLAGGTFVPATAVARRFAPDPVVGNVARFTGRQGDVLNALLKGASNKLIAYELSMAESTVKVHVRNIMRKLKARNRTHVAFLLNGRNGSVA